MPGTIEFWFDFASPYARISAARIERLAAPRAVTLRWRPFLIGPLLASRPGNPSPFQNAPPAQARYRRRDIERLCAAEGLPLTWPSTYPRGSLLATRIALIGVDRPWGAAFARAVFEASFAADRDIAVPAVLVPLLRDLGLPAEALIAEAATRPVKDRLRAQGEEAVARGLFGAPSFLVGDELFWGNDRLDQAIDWAARA
jgi:2-hydroxychromene-2-carboxylate isomerase